MSQSAHSRLSHHQQTGKSVTTCPQQTVTSPTDRTECLSLAKRSNWAAGSQPAHSRWSHHQQIQQSVTTCPQERVTSPTYRTECNTTCPQLMVTSPTYRMECNNLPRADGHVNQQIEHSVTTCPQEAVTELPTLHWTKV